MADLRRRFRRGQPRTQSFRPFNFSFERRDLFFSLKCLASVVDFVGILATCRPRFLGPFIGRLLLCLVLDTFGRMFLVGPLNDGARRAAAGRLSRLCDCSISDESQPQTSLQVCYPDTHPKMPQHWMWTASSDIRMTAPVARSRRT